MGENGNAGLGNLVTGEAKGTSGLMEEGGGYGEILKRGNREDEYPKGPKLLR